MAAEEIEDRPTVRLERDENVAVVTIDRPKVLNALDEATTRELGDVAGHIADDPDLLAVVITGAGERAFVAGADIAVLATYGPEEARGAARLGQATFDRIERLDVPVIAAINGYALGGGCELALACHLRIASERARLGLPEIDLGVLPGHGGTQRLPRLVGRARALELICSGRHVDAEEAESIGLVDEVVPHERLMERATELARRLAGKAPLALRYAMRAVREGLETTLQEGQALEAAYFGLAFATEDQAEGMRAFLDKREPEWKGR